MSQLPLGPERLDPGPSTRERVLATTIAGFAHPGRGGFENLRKRERAACLDAARAALEIAADGMAAFLLRGVAGAAR